MTQAGQPTGRVFDIQRASFNDGPGLRTTVFLRGCPLRCAWCHNPESWRMTARPGERYEEPMSVEDVMRIVLADRAYYATSGGGLTISGGEPTVQIDFAEALLRAARDAGIHTCLDTCGDAPSDHVERVHPHVSLYLFDLKLPDDASYLKWTGRGSGRIVANLQWILDHGGQVLLRCPILPGVNDSDDHFAQIARWRRHPGVLGVDLLPYHTTGNHKFAREGLELPQLPADAARVPNAADVARSRAAVDRLATS
jgi:pyruvate formate lyase activating enzyme